MIHCERPASNSSPSGARAGSTVRIGRTGQKKLFDAQDFALQKDLFGHLKSRIPTIAQLLCCKRAHSLLPSHGRS